MTTAQTLPRLPTRPWRWVAWLLVSQMLVALAWGWLGWKAGLPLLLASHALFIVPVFLPNSRFYGPVLSRLPGPAVWLTIDDGPSDDTLAILDLLDHHGAKATFFMVGERAAARPELVREVLRRGHGIGNHSHSHPQARFWRLGPWRSVREIGDCQQTLAALAGRPPCWYRSVVGMTNPFVAAALSGTGLHRVGWSARGFDGVGCRPDAVVARITRDLVPGAIVLLHEGAAHGHNPAIVEAVLHELQARGLRADLPPERQPALTAARPAASC